MLFFCQSICNNYLCQYEEDDIDMEGDEATEGRRKTKKVRQKRVKTAASVSHNLLSIYSIFTQYVHVC